MVVISHGKSTRQASATLGARFCIILLCFAAWQSLLSLHGSSRRLRAAKMHHAEEALEHLGSLASKKTDIVMSDELHKSSPLETSIKMKQNSFLSQKDIFAMQAKSKAVVLPDGYDVIDIGSSKGQGSVEFLEAALSKNLGEEAKQVIRPRTLGLDIDPAKVETCMKAGNECMQADILKMSPTENKGKVGGVTMWHVLEHMPTCDISESIWERTSAVARNFVSFRGPVFDGQDILKAAGNFHRYYENWSGHTCHFNSTILHHAITSSSMQANAYIVAVMKPFSSSASDVILPPSARKNSGHYNDEIHPKKDIVDFGKTLYEEMRACAVLEDVGKGSIGLDSALCLNDVLGVMMGRQGKVAYCHMPGTTSPQQCQDALQYLVKKTITMAKSNNHTQLRGLIL